MSAARLKQMELPRH